MMENLVVGLLSFVALVAIAGPTKDGPFPMKKAIGRWTSGDLPGLTVEISRERYNPKDKTVKVHVEIRDKDGNLVYYGEDRHSLDNKTLEMDVVDQRDGTMHKLKIRAKYPNDEYDPQSDRFSLVMDLVCPPKPGKASGGDVGSIQLIRDSESTRP